MRFPQAAVELVDEGALTLLGLFKFGVVLVDARGKVVYANRAARALFESDDESDLAGAKPFEPIHETTLADGSIVDPRRHPAAIAMRTGVPQCDVLTRVARADGSSAWLSVDAYPLHRPGDATASAALVTLTDVTARYSAESALREHNEQRLHALLEHSSDVIATTDGEGVLQYVSPACERVLGYTTAEWLGRNILEAVHPDDIERAAQSLSSTSTTPGPNVAFETRVADASGRWRSVEVIANNMLHDRVIGGIVFNVRDIGDRVEAEAERRRQEVALREAERLRARHEAELERRGLEAELARAQRLESLGRLATGVAHDFNNLLGVILNYAASAARHTTSSELARDIADIRRAAEAAGDITRKLLMFGRADPGQAVSHDLNALVKEAVELIDRAIGSEVRLQLELSPDPCVVRADRSQLGQVLINLIMNACDAMRGGGTITLRTSRTREPAHVVLEVCDDGAGMSSDVVRRAFEPFFTTKPPERGTGLGLATVHGIVNNAGGEVTIDSEVGKGTCVRVYLPEAARVDATLECRS